MRGTFFEDVSITGSTLMLMACVLQVIKAASNSSSYSWCTCSEEICEQQLGGRVAWNQHGVGWKGFAPAYDRPVLNAASGLPSSGEL